MTHAMCRHAGIGSFGLWSIGRGLARGLRDPAEYKSFMALADEPRRGDLDGRGNLSLKAPETFTGWFLAVMLDQIRFSEAVFDFATLERRYKALLLRLYPDRPRYATLVAHVLKHGEMDRGVARTVTGTSDRTATGDLSVLTAAGFLKSDRAKGPVRVGFPLAYRESLFPNLFTDAEIAAPEPPMPP